MDIKNIHIGKLIKKAWEQKGGEIEHVCSFLDCEEEDIWLMFKQKSIETEKLLRWSKLLEYDFFRVYSQHLILFAPKATGRYEKRKVQVKTAENKVPTFRKNIYTKEIIDHLLDLIKSKNKTPTQIITEYKIPKTTLYRWMQKYNVKGRQ